jgi:hypothetical protein
VRHVTYLVSQADAIVLDATNWSDAMETELSIIEARGASDRLIVLTRDNGRAEPEASIPGQLGYKTSWKQAGHRMFWGFLLTLWPAVVGDEAGWSLPTRIGVTVPAMFAWLLLAVRPLMDADAANELTRRLASITRTGPRPPNENDAHRR